MGNHSSNQSMKKQTLPKNDYKKLWRQLNKYGFKTYSEFLSSDLWKEFRKAMIGVKESNRCSICKDITSFGMSLHHKTYKQLLNPDYVIWVCRYCHSDIHQQNIDRSLSEITDNVRKEKEKVTERRRKKNLGKKKAKFSKRTASLRIVPSSGLPETLHHSLHSSGLAQATNYITFIRKYQRKKVELTDILMCSLLDRYSTEVVSFVKSYIESNNN